MFGSGTGVDGGSEGDVLKKGPSIAKMRAEDNVGVAFFF